MWEMLKADWLRRVVCGMAGVWLGVGLWSTTPAGICGTTRRNWMTLTGIFLAAFVGFCGAVRGQSEPNFNPLSTNDYFIKFWTSGQQEALISDLNTAPNSLIAALEKERCATPKRDGVYQSFEYWRRPVRIFKLDSDESARVLILASCDEHEVAFVVPGPPYRDRVVPIEKLYYPAFTADQGIEIVSAFQRLEWGSATRNLFAFYRSDFLSTSGPQTCTRFSYELKKPISLWAGAVAKVVGIG